MITYIDYKEGTTNLLLTASHGGNKKPDTIPNRTKGKLFRDTYTQPLVYKLLDKFSYYNKPYYIIADIHRKKIDLNRNLSNGTERNPYQEAIWYYWNYVLSKSKYEILDKNKYGLHIDIHSHNNSDEFHLGYNLSTETCIKLAKGWRVLGSSLDSIDKDLNNMVHGKYSLKSSMEKFGFSIFEPTLGKEYFNGGYNIETSNGNGLGGIQIEIPVSVLRVKREEIIEALYESIIIFKENFIDK